MARPKTEGGKFVEMLTHVLVFDQRSNEYV